VGFLFLLSVVLCTCALVWGYFADGAPQIARKISDVANQSTSWFGLLIVSFGIISVLDLGGGIGWFGGHRGSSPRRTPNSSGAIDPRAMGAQPKHDAE
jgi:hypothetical protein